MGWVKSLVGAFSKEAPGAAAETLAKAEPMPKIGEDVSFSKLERAKAMEGAGLGADEISAETGWQRGADGQTWEQMPLILGNENRVIDLENPIAFHGTTAEFDRFSTESIGSGEGAQAFGPGLYFTQSESIADFYRRQALRIGSRATVNGETFNKSNPAHYAAAVYWEIRNSRKHSKAINNKVSPFHEASYQSHTYAWYHALQNMIHMRDQIRAGKEVDGFQSPSRERPVIREPEALARFLDDAITSMKSVDPKKSNTAPKLGVSKNAGKSGGSIYKVAVNLTPDSTIDYDLPIAQQQPKVRAAIEEMIKTGVLGEKGAELYAKNGETTLMSDVVGLLGGPGSPAMLDLQSRGIRGIRYYSALARQYSSRGAGFQQNGAHNLVVFDDKHVAIIGEDGKLKTPLAGASLALALGGASGLGQEADAQEMPVDAAPADQPMPQAAPVSPVVPQPPAGFQRGGRNPTYERFRATTIPGMEAAPETVSGLETNGQITRPDGGEVWGAAFRMENVIGAMMSREQPDYGEWDPEFDPLAPENLEGYEAFSDRFIDARTAKRQEQIKRQIDRELEDRQTLMRGGFNAFAAQLVAGTVDPTILIPIGGSVKKGETLLKIGGRYALGAGAGATLSEGILHQYEETRTIEESALNIGGATLLGGLLGSGGYATTRKLTGRPVWGFEPDMVDVPKRLEQEMIYDPENDPILGPEKMDTEAMREAASAGAAAAPKATLEDYELAGSLGVGDVSAAMKMNPLLRLSTAQSAKAREVGNMLMENGMYLGRNKEGKASPISVEQAMTEYRGWHASAERTAQKALKDYRKSKGPMSSRQFYEEVGRALRRADQHENPHVEAAAKAYREAIEKTKERAIEAGLMPPDVEVKTAASYFHRMWNRNVLIRKPDEFKRMVGIWMDDMFERMRVRAGNLEAEAAQTGVKLEGDDAAFVKQVQGLMEIERVEGSLEGYRNESVEHIYDTLMGHDSRTLPHSITAGPRGPLKERTFSIPDLFEADGIRVEDFLVNDAQEVMDRYMRVMAADIELARTFGSPDMKDAIKGVMDEYKALIAAAKGEAAKKALGKEMEARVRDLEGVRDVIRGNFGKPTYDNAWARGAAVVRSWNYATLLGGMTVSAMPDVANKILANGFMGIARDLVVPLIADLGKVKITATEARTLGIAVEQTLATRIATMADIGDVYGRGTVFERAVGAMTNHFTKWTGMRLWNDVMKQSDYIMASNRAVRAMERPDKMGKATKAWLANLGIGEADYARIMAQVKKHGETAGAMKLTHADKWDDPVARRIWIGAMGKNANIQTVTPGAGDKLLMMNTELGKTIGQFKTFTFGANQRVTIRMAQQARMGHARVVSALVSYISLGMLVYYLKMIGSGREPSEDPVTWVREGIDRSGVVSVFMEGFNTAEKVTGQTFVGDSPASRYASRGKFASLLGPSVGKGEDAVTALSNLLDGELQDKDIHAVRKLLPYNNIFWLRTIFDELEMAGVEATGAEETALSDRRQSILTD